MAADEREPEDVFGIVANETRVGIIEAFVDARQKQYRGREIADREDLVVSLGFSELQDAVGTRDSGRFNYHLQELLGSFVTETDDGEYRLTWAGEEMAGSILSGTYGYGGTESAVLDSSCPECGDAVQAVFREGALAVACENEHYLLTTGLPTGAREGRSIEEVLDLAVRKQRYERDLILDGVCPMCYGQAAVSLGPVAFLDGVEYGLSGTCRRCGLFFASNLAACVLGHSSVVAFYANHGIDLLDQYPWDVDVTRDGSAVTAVAEDPYRFEVTVELDGDVLVVTVDESGDVVDTHRA